MDKDAKIKQLERSIEIYMKNSMELEDQNNLLKKELTKLKVGSKAIAWEIVEAKNMVIFTDGSFGKLTPGSMICRLAGD